MLLTRHHRRRAKGKAARIALLSAWIGKGRRHG